MTVILCVFLLSYIYAEGKSNYFKVSRTLNSSMDLANLRIVGIHFNSELPHGNDGVLF